MDKKENENNYREERKQRLAKAAKKQNKKKGDTADVIVGIIKALAIVVAIGIVLGALYVYGVPQSLLPALKVGDRTYTMSEYSYYYSSTFQTYANTAYSYQSQYGFNLSGFDYTVSPAEQTKKDDDGNWTYVTSDREAHDQPTVTATYAVSKEAVAELETFISEKKILSLESRPESDLFATDYSPWSWSFDYEKTSFGKTKQEYCRFGEYQRYSDKDYELLNELKERFSAVCGEKISEKKEKR